MELQKQLERSNASKNLRAHRLFNTIPIF